MKVKDSFIASLVAIVMTLNVGICAMAVPFANQEKEKD
jgi:hypothetical protein